MLPLLPTADHAEAPSGLSVLLPPYFEIFLSALILLLLWFVLGWAIPKIYKVLDEREAKIKEGLSAADTAKEEAALARREREQLLQQAREEAKKIREQAGMDAQRIVSQASADAQGEADRITDNARRHISAEREAAAVSLRQDVGALATELAERIIGEQLKDQKLSARVIDRFMDDLEEDLQNSDSKVDA